MNYVLKENETSVSVFFLLAIGTVLLSLIRAKQKAPSIYS